VSGIVVTGVLSVSVSQAMAFSENERFEASWNSYEIAPGTGFQAKEGVQANSRVGSSGSVARRRNACRFCGAAWACAAGARMSAARSATRQRGTMTHPFLSARLQAALP